jgi:hypothetical protein
MKRFSAAWLLTSLVACTAAAQTAPAGSASVNKSDSSRVILRGMGGTASTSSTQATTAAELTFTPIAAKAPEASGDTQLATCGKCGHEWTGCCCPQGCGLTIFGEWMFLQPRGADAVFAARALNCFDPPLETSQIDFGAFDSFRVGFSKTLGDKCSEIGATFWMFEAQEEEHAPRTTGTDVILPLLLHPSQITCPGSTSTLARASAGIDFDRVNIDYKHYLTANCIQFDCLIGFGYAKLEQDLIATFDEGSSRADSDLHGYGLRLGAGASKSCGSCNWLSSYLHADFTLLAANVNARYRAFDAFNGKVVDFSQDLDRLVPVLDLEVGVSANVSCHTTLKLGYIYSIWWNVVTNQSFIEDVQHGDISGGVGDTLTFDGLFARVEFVF